MALPQVGATGIDTSDATTKTDAIASAPEENTHESGDDPFGLNDAEYLRLLRAAVNQSDQFLNMGVRAAWDRSYRAWRNEHFSGSKYNSDAYKGRSRTFRPKTRSAIRKMLTSTAKAMFGTGDVVSISAENETDDFQQAAAAVKQEIINYRLSRLARRNGVPWMRIVLGARFISAVTSYCASKQFWSYKEKVGQDGQTKVEIDKPEILLFPSENVRFDPNCDWTMPAQSSAYLMLDYPGTVDDHYEFITANSGRASNIPWRHVTREQLQSAVSTTGPNGSAQTRNSREGGRDPISNASGAFAPAWLRETFMRVRGEDMVFWTINDNLLLSDPVPVEQAYPEFHGERPVVIGYGSLDPHRAIPMSAVESWQGLQQEANDAANLRQDHIKQAVSPPAKVKRGRKIDYTAVQRRGQSGIITVQEMDDIEWAEIPPIPSSSYEEDNQRNADFDDLAGVFNSGSVQTNKALNETVGGMRLMSGDANSIADFDLEVFVETYAEPVLFQLMRLEEFYETDEKVLQIAGHRAKLWQKFGTDAITDEMLLAETTITIKVGVGANNDPQSRLNNFMMANGAAQQALMPFVQGGMLKIIPNGEEIANTIFSAAGIKDGAERFYQIVPQDPSQQPNPQTRKCWKRRTKPRTFRSRTRRSRPTRC
jgi:hypothetical protein